MEDILQQSSFQQTLGRLASEQGISMGQAQEEARVYLKELYTQHQPITQLIGSQVGQYLLSRGYQKNIDVSTAEMRQLSKLMRKHPVAFVMTHKTYIDMLVLALVLIRHGLPLPYTFAGINMDFMGMGQFGRNAGLIFIRRSFKDNPIYKATLRHYIAHLVSEKGHFMWALEGTRSRTGKLVWPKMGILKYIMEGEEDAGEPVKYIPVSIVYDLIPDVKDMTEQSLGAEKKPESLGWFINYMRKMGDNLGRISVRFGSPLELGSDMKAPVPLAKAGQPLGTLPKVAFELVHRINKITPVTTTSLVCIALLGKFALRKTEMERDVVQLMTLIEKHKQDALVDRGQPIGQSVQNAIQLLGKADIIQRQGESLLAKYNINPRHYLAASYYSNMAVHHLYRRAFIELALAATAEPKKKNRSLDFWEAIMQLRDLFKFEFFYSSKAQFTSEIEKDFATIDPEWVKLLQSRKNYLLLLQKQQLLVAPVVLFHYVEAYQVVGQALLNWNPYQPFDEDEFLAECMSLGAEMEWQGRIQRIESVAKPFLTNGLRLAKNRDLIPNASDDKEVAILAFINELEVCNERLRSIQKIILARPKIKERAIPVERDIVPGSTTAGLTNDIITGESGSHIAAYFDLDRTLIRGFSAKNFAQSRLLSGKMTAKELVAQFAGVFVYATGKGNFAGLAAVSAQGIKGVDEDVFIQLGEDVYNESLAETIYPEARALVAAHLAKGHTVAIVSAATPYQVNPISRDLGIEHVMCTRMEVERGKFTGRIIEPACWGEGKAIAGRQFAEAHSIDLNKSYFYTDSAEDLPLLEIVGNPRPMNPDVKLSGLAFQNDWPIYRFNSEEKPGMTNVARTALTLGSLIPAALTGVFTGARTFSIRDGVNAMIAAVGDLGTAMAGINVVVKNEELIWTNRPAVFFFNHQSSADLFIVAKLLRRDVTAVAKKELRNFPILGQMMEMAGVIFLDRKNKDKAIAALKPAVDSLRNGMSIAIAPEGTRSKDYTLGSFKKGGFHLAMQAGVPIVPIIIKNAYDAMPKDSNVFRPSSIEVIIKPAIPTINWKQEELNDRVAEVRQLYLDELGQ